jgi:uncharacterized protein (DUF1330 family)
MFGRRRSGQDNLSPVLIAMIAEIEPAGVEAFRAYEDRVLALLPRHGGRLERRVRSAAGTTEIHLVAFEDQAGYDAYIEDPERAGARALLAGVEITQRVLGVSDVPV